MTEAAVPTPTEQDRQRAMALSYLSRQVNGRARYVALVFVRSNSGLVRFMVNRADYRRRNDPKGTLPRVEFYQGPYRVAVLYDAAGWEAVG